MGHQSGRKNETGSYNTFVGVDTGLANEDGERNTVLGFWAGQGNVSGDRNVFLGHMAGFNETESNKLYIDSSFTQYPLICGDFETNNVVINGGFRAVAIASSSDKRWKRNIEPLAYIEYSED